MVGVGNGSDFNISEGVPASSAQSAKRWETK